MISAAVYYLFEIYSYLILLYCLASFLPFSFAAKPAVAVVLRLIFRAVAPAFNLLNSIIPRRFLTIGMFDLSPILLLLACNGGGTLLARLLWSYGL